MVISTTNGSLYFTIFYSLAFLIVFLMLIWEGYQRKIQLIPWVLLLIFARISFITGTKIFTFTRHEWWLIVNQSALIQTSEKILLGGIILGIIALVTGRYVLRIRQNILDAFAIIAPLGFAIQKIGCFMNGCCYGKPTSLPWGVQYPADTLPHYSQFKSGLIGTNELLSQHIHPVQLYEMAGALMVAFIVYKTRKSWKMNGSLFIFSILAFCIVRFLTEFFRDIPAHTVGGEMVGIFNQIQWTLLIAIIALTFILHYREKQTALHLSGSPTGQSTIGIKSYLLIFSFEALLIWALRNWFSLSELWAVLATFLISGIIIFSWILREIASSKSKMAYAAFLLLPLVIMSQTIPPAKSDSIQVIRTKKISLGVASGSFENSFRRLTGTSSDGCGNTYEKHYINQKYTIWGAAYSVKDEYPQKKFAVNYGVNMYLGQNVEQLDSKTIGTKDMLYGINPFIKFDAKWFGIGGGIHAGNVVYTNSDIVDEGDATTARVKSSVYPQAYFRLGQQKAFYIDYRLGDQFPSPFPGFTQQIGIGTGFGSKDVNFRIGILAPESGGYFSAYFPVSKTLSFEPMIALSGSQINNFSLGVHYNLSSNTFYRKKR